MTVRIDLAWLLLVAEQHTPGDPAITDWGALVAAVSRHEAEIIGVPVYTDPQDRAAALLQILLRVPALERSNAMFATAVAYGYLVASGLKIATSPERVRDLARLVKDDTTELSAIADELRSWTA
ncbi:fic family toxin-antitoxin system, toxin component [Streptomyces sp. NPDC059080]|uniref:fic family toxin-antitoxin system, toxin component n=1 Tax=Streptomyces sp. NPDC059080 TaxID=3346718 RepID=UPI0036A574B8